ncbi:hypothetical protein CEXT_151321 [Caerostris extrusa]|uniref:Uncharacterized protein n=1 Tax=Caerostris extrusa TaxID=172846 RepID=A0AAV4XMI9_CAEEX|nr:hypothetical protein CEXT_151321 [Caerostris extrusa]
MGNPSKKTVIIFVGGNTKASSYRAVHPRKLLLFMWGENEESSYRQSIKENCIYLCGRKERNYPTDSPSKKNCNYWGRKTRNLPTGILLKENCNYLCGKKKKEIILQAVHPRKTAIIYVEEKQGIFL